jgi:hypothetical protein
MMFLVLLVCLFVVVFRSDARFTLEGACSKSFQEQELKTLGSYYLEERQVFLDHAFVLIIAINITFFSACMCLNLMDPN